ncbi:MAG: c-type cytochrome [Betaproteobacteria bacterium]
MRSAALLTTCLAFGVSGATALGNVHGGDATRGAEVYTRCQACHALKYNRTGPKHCGVVGRKAGSVPNFDYSPAMRRSKLTWDEQTLDRFLADPMKTVPGTSMTYAGVSDPQDRADLIAYLREAGGSELCK